jgi:hypothetical protein
MEDGGPFWWGNWVTPAGCGGSLPAGFSGGQPLACDGTMGSIGFFARVVSVKVSIASSLFVQEWSEPFLSFTLPGG